MSTQFDWNISTLKEALVPKGDKPVIALRMTGFFNSDFVQEALDELERKVMMQGMGIDVLSKADILALHLLKDSAGL